MNSSSSGADEAYSAFLEVVGTPPPGGGKTSGPAAKDVDDDAGKSWRDEEEGGDTLAELPSPPPGGGLSRSLPAPRGLEREFSLRLGGTGGNGDDRPAPNFNFTDYLRAQRAIHHSHRSLPSANPRGEGGDDPAAAQRQQPSAQTSVAVASAVAKLRRRTNHGNAAASGNDPAAAAAQQQPSAQTSVAVASAVAKLRRRSVNGNAAGGAGGVATANFVRKASDATEDDDAREQRTLQALGALSRQGSVADWEAIFDELGHVDEDGHFDEGHHDDILPWYAAPIQRQRWDKDQILPHVNWGDLFFDLFYVAAAYNLGVMLTSSMNEQDFLRGAVYYVGTFGPLYRSWETSMFYESRYTTVDYAHRLFEVVRYLFVSTAIVHVTSLDFMADPKSTETLLFTCAVLCESLMHLALNIELYFKGQGESGAIRNHTMVMIKYQILPVTLVYVAAVVAAAVQFAWPEEGGDNGAHRILAAGAGAAADYDAYGGGGHAKSPMWELSDLPLTLTAFGYLQDIVVSTISNFQTTNGKRGDIRERFVPNNVDYVIHRYGEWILLMIGEGILSLLIVETTENKDYYTITTLGVLTVIFIQILKFESEPSHAEGHAIWRTFTNSMCYSYLIQVLSMALIVFGVTYKVFLKNIVKEAEKKAADDVFDHGSKASRMLAASPAIADDVIAAYFSAGLSIVLVALELMCLTHCGIKRALEHLVRRAKREHPEKREEHTPHWPVIIIALFKVGIMVFTMTLRQWTTDPAVLTFCGLCIVLALSITRIMNYFFIHKKEVIQNLTDNVLSATDNVLSGVRATINMSGVNAGQAASAAFNSVANGSFGGNYDDASATSSNRTGDSVVGAKQGEDETSITPSVDTNLVSGINNSSFDAVVIADLNGIVTQVNDIAVTMFGYASKVEMIGKNLSILVGGSDGSRHVGYVKAFKKRVTTQGNPHHKVLGRQRMLHACKADGTEFPCIVGIKMVSNDTRIAGYIRDMSGVKTEEKQRASMIAMDAVVHDHTFDAIIATNNRGVIQKVNDQAVIEFGYDDKDDLVGKNISMLVHDLLNCPELLSQEQQRVVDLTRKDEKKIQCILASKKVKGVDDLIVSHIRNLDSIKASSKVGIV